MPSATKVLSPLNDDYALPQILPFNATFCRVMPRRFFQCQGYDLAAVGYSGQQ